MGGDGRTSAKLRDPEVTAGRHKVWAVVRVKAKDMKEAWCLTAIDAERARDQLATTLSPQTAATSRGGARGDAC